MVKGCLYCGLQLPDTTDFCPQCGRPIEKAIRVESGVKKRRTTIIKGCLYCDLQLTDDTDFCPQCGRPIERGFEIRQTSDEQVPGTRKDGRHSVPGTRKRRHYISHSQISVTEH